jgi:hypothetical protein
MSIYNRDGFFEENKYDSYSANNVTAVANQDGAAILNLSPRRGKDSPTISISWTAGTTPSASTGHGRQSSTEPGKPPNQSQSAEIRPPISGNMRYLCRSYPCGLQTDDCRAVAASRIEESAASP